MSAVAAKQPTARVCASLATKSASVATADHDGNNTLALSLKPGETTGRAKSRMASGGVVANASVAMKFGETMFGKLGLMDTAQEMQAIGLAVNANDLSGLERMLTAQVVGLNSMFTELARRAALNLGNQLSATDIYVRLALKTQSQCRATVETLATIKNPPTVFARQANFSGGGPQQVNNASPAPAKPHQSARIELLEEQRGKRMDAGTQGAASRTHPAMAAVGEVDRTPIERRQGGRQDEPLSRRATSTATPVRKSAKSPAGGAAKCQR